jgi:hypothetical protein
MVSISDMLTSYYGTLLAIHCDLRWLVLLAGIAAIAVACIGLFNKASFAPLGRIAGLIYVSLVDTQVLIGILLWFPSPYVRAFLTNPAEGMKQHDPRFFVVEHTVMMLLAVILAHIGAVRSRRASGARAAYGAALKWYAASLIVILAGIPWWRPLLQL